MSDVWKLYRTLGAAMKLKSGALLTLLLVKSVNYSGPFRERENYSGVHISMVWIKKEIEFPRGIVELLPAIASQKHHKSEFLLPSNIRLALKKKTSQLVRKFREVWNQVTTTPIWLVYETFGTKTIFLKAQLGDLWWANHTLFLQGCNIKPLERELWSR